MRSSRVSSLISAPSMAITIAAATISRTIIVDLLHPLTGIRRAPDDRRMRDVLFGDVEAVETLFGLYDFADRKQQRYSNDNRKHQKHLNPLHLSSMLASASTGNPSPFFFSGKPDALARHDLLAR